jgi:large subunit ribosomal protein L13
MKTSLLKDDRPIHPTKTLSLGSIKTSNRWWVIDGQNLVLGRLASQIAMMLRGKNKAEFMPYDPNCGDFVVVINAEKIALTGNKRSKKRFYWHTGYAGGIKSRTMAELLDGAYPDRVLYKAVERMIGKGPLREKVMTRLRIYKGGEHPHSAQGPEIFDFGSLNRKNVHMS